MAQPCQNRCRQIQATKTASIGLAYDFLRFLRLPHIVRLDGFSHSELKGNLLDSFEQTDASDALADSAMHVPVVPLVMSLYRNYHAVQQGRDVTVAAQHVAYDTVIRGGAGQTYVGSCQCRRTKFTKPLTSLRKSSSDRPLRSMA